MDAKRITAQEVRRRMDSGERLTFLDTRNPVAWGEADTMIPNATRAGLEDLEAMMSRIPRDTAVVAYCT